MHIGSIILVSLGVVFLLLETEDRSVRFHAFQSILLGAIVIILQIGIRIIGFIPPLGFLLAVVLKWAVGIAWVVLTIYLMYRAYGDDLYQLPYLGPRAARLSRLQDDRGAE